MKRISMFAAVVHCAGGCTKLEDGTTCRNGCIGCGKCVKVCRMDAIAIDPVEKIAKIDRTKCVGCGNCVKECPRGVISTEPRDGMIMPLCSNLDDGKKARQICQNSCIACGLCVKNCPCGAIEIVDHHPVINPNYCVSCGMCAVKCPRGVIHDARGILAKKY